jgi:hypothetical protein
LSSRCTALSSCHHAGWLLRRLSLRHPLVLLLRRPLFISSRQLVLAYPLVILSLRRLSSCHHAGWLLCCLSLRHPLVLLLRHPLILCSRQLIVALPLVVLLMCCPLVLSSRRLVVALPLLAPPSRPLVVPPSCLYRISTKLMPAGCCVASPCHAAVLPLVAPHCFLSRCPLALLSHQLVVALPLGILLLRCPSCHLFEPAGCCIASPCPLVVRPSHHLVAPAGSCIASRHPLVAPPFRPLITPAGCCVASRCASHLSSCCAALSSSQRAS